MGSFGQQSQGKVLPTNASRPQSNRKRNPGVGANDGYSRSLPESPERMNRTSFNLSVLVEPYSYGFPISQPFEKSQHRNSAWDINKNPKHRKELYMNNRKNSLSYHAAFTLIELLVVIAII